MTMIHHDSRCDRRHTSRQRCNRALGPMTPADDRVASLSVEVAVAEPPVPPQAPIVETEPEPEQAERSPGRDAVAMDEAPLPAPPFVEPEPEPEPSLIREAVAMDEAPEPTVFVSREWDATADAVERTYRSPSPTPRAVPQDDRSTTAALIGLAVALAVVLLLAMRGRRKQPAD